MRSIWEFSLPTNLPTGYYVKKVELKYTGNSFQSFIMKYISEYPSNPTYPQKCQGPKVFPSIFELGP